MAKDQDIHKIIERQDPDGKAKSWEKLQIKLAEAGEDVSTDKPATVKKPFWTRRNIAFISVAVVLILSGILIPLLLPREPEIRYCTLNDYHVLETEQYISEYATQNNKSMLYFDWKDGAERVIGQQYLLNDTDEAICWYEDGFDAEGVMLYYYVAEKKYDLDILSNYKIICSKINTIDKTEVLYGINTNYLYAMFKHGNYSYYVQVDDAPDEDYIFTVVQKLLSSEKTK